LTVTSTRTGEHRTFRISTQAADAEFAPGERIVGLLTGADNERDYTSFAFLKTEADGSVRLIVWKRHRGGQYDALARMLEALPAHEAAGRVATNFDTRCRKCNRTLTTPESVASGIGPVCAESLGA
jgi:hypothetical protein